MKRIHVAVGLATTWTLLLSACGDDSRPSPDNVASDAAVASAPTPVRIAEAEATNGPVRLLSSGTVSSRAEMDLSFKVSGYVDAVHVREGQRVSAGQVLATLQTTEVDAGVRAAKAQADLAAQNLARTERLVRDSIMAPVRLDEARDVAERAQASLAVAEFNRAHAAVRAPSSGRIIRRYVEASEFAGPGTPVVRFGSDAGGWIVVLNVADHEVVDLRVGNPATVHFTALAAIGPVEGRVSEIADGADPRTGTFRVELEVSSSLDVALRSGMVARAEIEMAGTGERTEASVSLPISAIVDGEGMEAAVFVVDDGFARRVGVQVAAVEGDRVRIRAPEIGGRPVVVTGAPYLRDGDPVTVADSHASAQEPLR